MVNTKLRDVAKMHLLNLKSKHTKLNDISNSYKLEEYLSSTNISTEEKQTLFEFRTRMVDVKSNFKMQYGQNLTCYFCLETDTQSHLLLCKPITNWIDMQSTEYDQIFQDISKQEKIPKILKRILKQRNTLLEKRSMSNEETLSQGFLWEPCVVPRMHLFVYDMDQYIYIVSQDPPWINQNREAVTDKVNWF